MKRSVKILSFVLSVCMIISVLGICASAEEPTPQSRLLILSPKCEEGSVLGKNDYQINDTFSMLISDNKKRITFKNTAMTKSALQNAVSSFAKQTEAPVNYVYVTATGSVDSDGNAKVYLCDDGIYYSELREMLDAISGKVVIMIDADYSGDAISKSGEVNTASANVLDEKNEIETFNSSDIEQQIVDVFTKDESRLNDFETYANESAEKFDGKLKYIVFCSCLSNEMTGKKDMGFATEAWTSSFAVDTNDNTKYFADANNDNILTAKEVNDYTCQYLKDNYPERAEEYHPCYYSYYYFDTIYYKDFILGDVNMDGSVNMKDTLVLRQYISGSTSLNSRQIQLADINQDGTVNMKDYLFLRKYIAGQSVTEA